MRVMLSTASSHETVTMPARGWLQLARSGISGTVSYGSLMLIQGVIEAESDRTDSASMAHCLTGVVSLVVIMCCLFLFSC